VALINSAVFLCFETGPLKIKDFAMFSPTLLLEDKFVIFK
jgi:hypothetical protein